MVKKIKQRGPKALQAVPLVMAMTALFGFRREGREFRRQIVEVGRLRAAFRDYLGQVVIPADRPLSSAEYLDWVFAAGPGRSVKRLAASGVILMNPPAFETDPDDARPRLGILPLAVLVKAQHLDPLAGRIGQDFQEVSRVACERCLYPAFGMIPGYDLLLYLPPCHGQDLNWAVETLNRLVEEECARASVPSPGPLV